MIQKQRGWDSAGLAAHPNRRLPHGALQSGGGSMIARELDSEAGGDARPCHGTEGRRAKDCQTGQGQFDAESGGEGRGRAGPTEKDAGTPGPNRTDLAIQFSVGGAEGGNLKRGMFQGAERGGVLHESGGRPASISNALRT
ncbi:MAG: hypothetical protein M1837_001642 [Sclerophora amabilis]|nr:MAG: hypothetical protein M1837_001642 [Sclerophora amabilis]